MIHSPPNKAPIDILWAWLSVDEKGNEGICGGMVPGIGGIPFVTSDKKKADGIFRELALDGQREAAAAGIHKEVRLAAFRRTELA